MDRWKIYNALYNVSTKNLSNPNSSDGNLVQTFENPLNGTYTITVHCSSVTGIANFTFGGENVIVDKEVGDLKKGNNIVTIKATNLNFIGVLVKSGASVNIDYIKLEQGTVATPFVAPNPAEELVKCRRYYNFIASHFYGVANPNGFINEDLASFRNFRINPTIDIKATYSSGVTESTLTLKGTNINGFYLYGRTRTSGDYALDVTITADAEIY